MSTAFVIFATDAGPWLAAHGVQHRPVDLAATASADERARALRAALDGLGYAGEAVVLAIPSGWCLAVSFAEPSAKGNRRSSLLYEMEQHLPVPAEDIVADFACGEGRCLGVALVAKTIQPMLEAIERAGIAVQSISPTALLALPSLRREGDQLALLGQDQSVDLVELEGERVVGWSVLPRDAARLAPAVRMILDRRSGGGGSPLRVRGAGLGDLVEPLRRIEQIELTDEPTDVTAAALAGADAARDGRRPPLIELRRGALGAADPLRQIRRPLNAALAAGILLLLALCVGLLVRSGRYKQATQAAERDQRAAYAEAMPNSPQPTNVTSRLRAVWREMAPSAGGALADVPRRSALRTLHDALAGLPTGVDYEVQVLDASADGLSLTGSVASYEQADVLASSMRSASGYRINSPSIRREADRAVFVITAERPGPESASPSAGGEAAP